MATDEEIEKTLEETRKTLEMGKKLEEAVNTMIQEKRDFYDEIGINEENLGKVFEGNDVSDKQKEAIAKERQEFEAELQEDIKAAEEAWRREKLGGKKKKKSSVRRKVRRNMV
jgi:hypothetical protein